MIQIVIADDHRLIADAWTEILGKDKRFEVAGRCGDNSEALKMCRSLRPNILLLDMNMPPFDGIEATEKIRKASPQTGIIAVTMNNHPAYAKKILRLGGMGYVTKASPMEEMTTAILEVSAGNLYICEEMKELMSQVKDDATDDSALQRLTKREMEVVGLIKDGLSSKEIGEQLHISCKTVETHRHNISKKLKIKNAVSLVHLLNKSPFHI